MDIEVPWFRPVGLNSYLDLRVIAAGPAGVTVEMAVDGPSLNSSGNLHGGAVATLIDAACGIACAVGAHLDGDKNTIVTVDLHIRYLGRPSTSIVRADARVVKAGARLVVTQCRVEDSAGSLVAVADMASMLVPRREPLVPPDPP